MNDKTDSYNVTSEADQAHDDQWLPDQIVALGIAEFQHNLGRGWYRLTNRTMSMGMQPKYFVRDPRVAMALMEKCLDAGLSHKGIRTALERDRQPYEFEWNKYGDKFGWVSCAIAQSDSLPRAITEACVEALS